MGSFPFGNPVRPRGGSFPFLGFGRRQSFWASHVVRTGRKRRRTPVAQTSSGGRLRFASVGPDSDPIITIGPRV